MAALFAALLAFLLALLHTAVAKQPGSLDAAGHPPDAKAMAAGSVFGIEIFASIALPQVFGIDKSLTVFDEGQVEVDIADHLGDGASVAIGVEGMDRHLPLQGQADLQIAAGLVAVGHLGHLGGVDACQPYRLQFVAVLDPNGVAIADRNDPGAKVGFGSGGGDLQPGQCGQAGQAGDQGDGGKPGVH